MFLRNMELVISFNTEHKDVFGKLIKYNFAKCEVYELLAE